VALNDIDILWLERNDTSVKTSEAIKSRLLSGVMGGAGFCSRRRRVARFFAPGTGSPQT
jgi:hypothetical protein